MGTVYSDPWAINSMAQRIPIYFYENKHANISSTMNNFSRTSSMKINKEQSINMFKVCEKMENGVATYNCKHYVNV